MIDTDVEQWLRQPVKTKANDMIELVIDKKNKAVWFKQALNFEEGQMILNALIDAFGWSRQDAQFGGIFGPTVEPGAPTPVTPGYFSTCTPVPCANCQEAKLAENKPLWEGDPRA